MHEHPLGFHLPISSLMFYNISYLKHTKLLLDGGDIESNPGPDDVIPRGGKGRPKGVPNKKGFKVWNFAKKGNSGLDECQSNVIYQPEGVPPLVLEDFTRQSMFF